MIDVRASRRLIGWGVVAILVMLTGCESMRPARVVQGASYRTVAIMSRLTDQISESRLKGLVQAFGPPIELSWRTNDAVRLSVAEGLRRLGYTVVNIPNPAVAVAPRLRPADRDEIMREIIASPDTARVDLVVLVDPVALNQMGAPWTVARLALGIFTGLPGSVNAFLERNRFGFVVMVPSSFNRAFGMPTTCMVGYAVHVIDPKRRTILNERNGAVSRAVLTGTIARSDYMASSEADKETLRTQCLSVLTNAVRMDVEGLMPPLDHDQRN